MVQEGKGLEGLKSRQRKTTRRWLQV